MDQRKGVFICLEGIDGCGKSTQRESMAEWFRANGFEVMLTREPGGTPYAENIRELLLKPTEERVTELTEVMLFFAARAQHLENLIVPALNRGVVVICDRFVDSTYAYQCAGGGIHKSVLDQLTQIVVGEYQPDMTFLLTMSVEEAKRRGGLRGTLDRMESKPGDYYDKAQQAYIDRAETYPHRYKIVDASMSIDQVYAQIVPTMMEIVNNLRQRPKPQE